MNEAFLKDGVDYEGTGELQTTSTRFDEALAQAAAALEFDSCVPEDFIRLVFMVRLEEGLPDGNCSPWTPICGQVMRGRPSSSPAEFTWKPLAAMRVPMKTAFQVM